MELILWRHAEAEDGWPDMARALTPKGHKQAEKMAAWLTSRLPPDTRILVSPALRTQQTAAALNMKFSTHEEIAPGAEAEALLQAANWPGDATNVLIVGHQPTLGAVAAMVLAGQQNASWSVKKGALWWISGRTRDDYTSTVLRAVMSPDLL